MTDHVVFFLQLVITGIAVGGVYSLMALGFVLMFKASAVVNFGPGELVLFGAYVAWATILSMKLPLYAALPIIHLVSIVLGLVIERGVLRPLIGHPKPRQVAPHRRVQLDCARLDQLHDRQGGERLAERGEVKRGPRGDRPPGGICRAVAPQVDDPVATDDAQRQARQAHGPHLPLHIAIEGGEIRPLRQGGDAIGERRRPAQLGGDCNQSGGLEVGDLVVALDGDRVTDGISLIVAIRSHQPGETVIFTVDRDGEERTLEVTLDSEVG